MGLRSVAMGFSKFDVYTDANGERQLLRNVRDTTVVGGATARERSLSEFRALAVQVTGRPPRAGQALPSNETAVSSPFTKLGGEPGYRWVEADSGTPVIWYKNTSAPPPLLTGDATGEIQTALAAWTNPPTATIVLQYGGASAQSSAEGPWSGLQASAVGLITFEDPNDQLSGSTLAIGGAASAISLGGGTVNGVRFHGIQRGFVIFQNAADLGTSYRQSLNFTRVLTHEIGHGIGLGHTQTDGSVANPTSNLMYPSCCYSEMPTPPSIGPDDLAGANAIYPAGASCSYTISPSAANAPAAGMTGSVSVATQTGCAWTASSGAAFATITGGSGGTGNGAVSYSVASNGVSLRTATLTIAGKSFTITQSGTGPSMTLDKTSLRFGATLNGAISVAKTAAQVVRLTQSGAGSVTWMASSNRSWLQVSTASGTGPASLSLTVTPDGLAPGSYSGVLNLTLSGAGNAAPPINVELLVMPNGQSAVPVGTVDTPANNATGVTGAIPITGWSLDDVDVSSVFICRSAVAGESLPADGRCAGNAQAFVGTGLFIDGARPDVQAALPNYPRNSAGGWGFMVLTNMLPNQGNGTFTFHVYSLDVEGHIVLLSTRTITCDNAHATLPFGTIDTPAQGDTISGTSYINFGWALTQAGKSIPTDGSTIAVFIDGVSVGTVSYNHYRSDIATLFPGLANSNGAVGFRAIDTTTLSNGLHTISWTATDSNNAVAGLGSRFFRVSNGAGAMTAAADAASSSVRVADLPIDGGAVVGRRGWDTSAPWRAYVVGASGRAVMRGEELDRFQLWLGTRAGEEYRGYLKVGGELAALPIGSTLDRSTGEFTWSPGVGFVGTYDLVFVRSARGRALAQQNVRIILRPKLSGYVGTQVEIDMPLTGQQVANGFALAGWAGDLDAAAGTGIDTLHAWAYPVAGGPPIFLGTPTLGGQRPDVAALHGEQFRDSGFGLVVQGLAPGVYDIAVFPWSNVIAGFAPAKVVRVTVQ
jgi:hypothetical protein